VIGEIMKEPTWRRESATQSGSIDGWFRRAPERFVGVDCSAVRCFDFDIGIFSFGDDCAVGVESELVFDLEAQSLIR
jgi:hypothetical protein